MKSRLEQNDRHSKSGRSLAGDVCYLVADYSSYLLLFGSYFLFIKQHAMKYCVETITYYRITVNVSGLKIKLKFKTSIFFPRTSDSFNKFDKNIKNCYYFVVLQVHNVRKVNIFYHKTIHLFDDFL